MMIPLVLTQPVVEEEILLTPMGTYGPKTRTIETITEEEEGLDWKGTPLNSLKATEAKPWSS
jgi:hypothetical protein